MKKIIFLLLLIMIVACEKKESVKSPEKKIVTINEWQGKEEVVNVEVLDDDGMIYVDKDNFVKIISEVKDYNLVEAIGEKVKFKSNNYEVIVNFKEKTIEKRLIKNNLKVVGTKEERIISVYEKYDEVFFKEYDKNELNYIEERVLIYDVAKFTDVNFIRNSQELERIYLTRGIIKSFVSMSKKTNEYSYEVLEEYMSDLVNLKILKIEDLEYLRENKEKFIKNFYKEMKKLTRKVDNGHFGMIVSKKILSNKNILVANKLGATYNFENNIKVEILNKDIAYLKIKSFDVSRNLFDEIEEAMDFVYAYENLIIDLRNNQGGLVDNRRYLISLLTNKNIFEYHLRKEGEIKTVLPNLSNKEYKGNIVLLTNKISYSCSTVFANNFKENSLGIIIGEKTSGGADSNNKLMLPNGVIIAKSSMRVATDKNYVSIDMGVEPDILIEDVATRKDRDPILTGALEYLDKNSY